MANSLNATNMAHCLGFVNYHIAFLKDLAAKTHRGLRGRVENGKSGGGLCYGYKVLKTLDERGEPVRGDREIDEPAASVVRRIFRDFAAGTGPRAIAKSLNDEGIPGPHGKLDASGNRLALTP